MINSLELKFFRKHEDLKVDFTKGLNVVRGPNEIGKTTLTEGILYALYGSAALVDTLAEVVTWGQKENALKAKLTISINDHAYVFTRSKSGAECEYSDGNDGTLRVTGQKEVTNFAATLLGADAKTAGVLMLASQSGLRGALDDGPAAVSSLMSKLADFDMLDRLLENAASTLSLGSAMPLTVKLTEAQNLVLESTAQLVDPQVIVDLDAEIAQLTLREAEAAETLNALELGVSNADAARDAAIANNASVASTRRTVDETQVKLDAEIRARDKAVAESLKRPAKAVIDLARAALASAKDHDKVLRAYALYGTLGPYPVAFWDDTQETFDAEVVRATAARDDALRAVDVNVAEAKALNLTFISGDGVCPTCNRPTDNHDHVTLHNKMVHDRLTEMSTMRESLIRGLTDATDMVKDLSQVAACAKRRQAVIDKIASHLVFDSSVYPHRVEWNGPPPSSDGDVSGTQRALDDLEAQDRAASQAEGRAVAHTARIDELGKALEWAKDVASRLQLIAVDPLTEAYDAAFRAYSEQSAVIRTLTNSRTELENRRTVVDMQMRQAAANLEIAKARVTELEADIKTLEFNNELVKRLKSMKPLITDFLWNNVLAAVSNYFSTLRGEQSIVTKDADGFKVNGRGGSLSGSTLDVLALAIRVALSKTFVPHANFMVLDEPAHGCDSVRTSNLLGFLSGVGFHQTLLASHDELSEAVADNVIVLGA